MGKLEKLEINRNVLVRLIKALMSEEDLNVVVNIIAMDPALSVRLLKFINSARFSFPKQIDSLQHAATLLGHSGLKEFAFALLTGAILHSSSIEEVQEVLEFAYLMKILAEKLYNIPGDRAFLVGLLYFVKEKIDGELQQILVDSGVSPEVLTGLFNPESRLNRLLKTVEGLLPLCKEFLRGDIEEIPSSDDERCKIFTESCLLAEQQVRQIIELLR